MHKWTSFPNFFRCFHWPAGFMIAAAVCITGMIAASNTYAQVTTKDLIGDAVSEIGNKYGDIDEAIKRFGNRDALGARQFLESAKRKDPSLPPIDLMLAKMYFLSNATGGRASLEKTVSDNPGDPEAYLILADQAITQNRTIEAEALYDKALMLNEKFSENGKRKRNFEIRGRSGRALVAQRRRSWQPAIDDLQALLKVDPDNTTAHYRLGQSLFMLKKYRDGYEEFKKAKQLDKEKTIPNPYVSAALMYDQLDLNDEAQKSFDFAMKEDKDAATIAAYAQWLIKTGAAEKAEAVLADARKANPSNLDILILSGVAARMQKKMKPAEDFLVEAFRLAPSNGGVINQLALLLIDQPDEDKRRRALEFAGINSRLNSDSADALITYAWVLFQMNRVADANEALNRGIQLGGGGPDSNYLVAKMIQDSNPSAAKQVLSRALEGDSQGIFVNRKEAQALLDSLGK
jgi:tetratricopeptide (TPR) repeat protein